MLFQLLRDLFGHATQGKRHHAPSDFAQAELTELFNAGKYAETETLARQLLTKYPDSGFIWKVLGAALQAQGGDALAAMSRAVELSEGDAQARTNLALVLRQQGRLSDAVEMFRQAAAISPNDCELHDHIGITLLELGKVQDAQAAFRKAITAAPGRANSHANLGLALRATGQLDEATTHLRTALTLNPGHAAACNAYGSTLMDQGLFEESETYFRRAIDCQSDYTDARNNLAYLLSKIGREDEAIEMFQNIIENQPWAPDAYDNLLYILTTARASHHTADALSVAKQYGASITRRAEPFTAWRSPPGTEQALRIGFLSADLRNHPVGYFLEGVLRSLADRHGARFEFTAYSNSIYFDELSERIAGHCARWQPVYGLPDRDLAQRIHDDAIDILIDLSGHTGGNRLPVFAWRPAPVQVTWLGYWATTGVAEIDYILADRWCLPESLTGQFSEQVWYLPETRLCFTPPAEAVPVAALPALRNGHVTFGCFNRLEKVSDEVIALWARIMTALPSSQLILKAKQLNSAGTRNWILDKFARHGIAATRLRLEGYSRREDYLAAYHEIDIALDPFPFTGGTTTAEGLWMGVPALTLSGDTCLSRQGVGLLMNAGLPEWVCHDQEDYVARAQAHAGDLPALAELRANLREHVLNSPIFDSQRFADHLAEAFTAMGRPGRVDAP